MHITSWGSSGSKRPAAQRPSDGDAAGGSEANSKQRRTVTVVPATCAMGLVSAAALQQLLAQLTAHEPDLTDHLLDLCEPRHTAAHRRELPPHPEGPMGTFTVTVPRGTTEIGWQAFWGCTSLTGITLPPTLAAIRGGGFFGCTSLTITLPPALTEIGEHAFEGCSSLTKIALPPALIQIGSQAFRGCTSLTKIALPFNLTEIGEHAFSGCTSLTNITLPPHVVIGSDAFHGVPGTPRRQTDQPPP